MYVINVERLAMVNIIKGQDILKSDWIDFKGVTTNSYVKKDGCLAMGRGFAKQVRDALPGFDHEAGVAVWVRNESDMCRDGYISDYGTVRLFKSNEYSNWFLFQVKRHFREQAELDIIRLSTKMLAALAELYPEEKWGVNFPGIGYGGLREEDVLPILNLLPDNVFVFKI